jgi:hypothetical protein
MGKVGFWEEVGLGFGLRRWEIPFVKEAKN